MKASPDNDKRRRPRRNPTIAVWFTNWGGVTGQLTSWGRTRPTGTHLKSFSPTWVCMWFLRSAVLRNTAPQTRHVNEVSSSTSSAQNKRVKCAIVTSQGQRQTKQQHACLLVVVHWWFRGLRENRAIDITLFAGRGESNWAAWATTTRSSKATTSFHEEVVPSGVETSRPA